MHMKLRMLFSQIINKNFWLREFK